MIKLAIKTGLWVGFYAVSCLLLVASVIAIAYQVIIQGSGEWMLVHGQGMFVVLAFIGFVAWLEFSVRCVTHGWLQADRVIAHYQQRRAVAEARRRLFLLFGSKLECNTDARSLLRKIAGVSPPVGTDANPYLLTRSMRINTKDSLQ